MYRVTFQYPNWDLLQPEIVDILVVLGLALANYSHTQSLHHMIIYGTKVTWYMITNGKKKTKKEKKEKRKKRKEKIGGALKLL